jgi:hypothetical protein
VVPVVLLVMVLDLMDLVVLLAVVLALMVMELLSQMMGLEFQLVAILLLVDNPLQIPQSFNQ